MSKRNGSYWAENDLLLSEDAKAIIHAGLSAASDPSGNTSSPHSIEDAVERAIGEVSLRYLGTQAAEMRPLGALREIAVLYVQEKARSASQ
jgi:hypothetical protein